MSRRYLLTTVAATALLIGEARADSTVAAMTAASALAGPELFYCVQTAADRNCTATQLKTFITSSGVVTSVGFSVPATSIFTATGSPVTGAGTLGFTTTGTSGGIPYFSSAAALSSSGALTSGAPILGGAPPTSGTVSGNTTKFATVNVTTFVSGNCVQVDASSNLTTAAAACGTSGITFPQTVAGTTSSGGIPYFSSPTVLSSSGALTANVPILGGSPPTSGTVSGNTTKFATVNATTFATGQCVQVDASLNLTTTGSACGAGGGGLPLVGTGLTYTTNTPLLDLSQTWNNNAVLFQAIRLNVTGTAFAANSKVIDLQVGGLPIFAAGPIAGSQDTAIYLGGNTTTANILTQSNGADLTMRAIGGTFTFRYGANNAFRYLDSDGIVTFYPGLQLNNAAGTINPSLITGGATNYTVEQRQGTNANTFLVYNTWSSSTSYERAVLDWTTTANTLTIGAQFGAPGVARQVNIAAPLHLNYTSGTPTANSCAGFALTTGSSDVAGKVTFTSATACSITFANAFINAPFCVVSPGSAASTHTAVTSTTGLAVTFGTANTSMQWHCFGS